MRIAHGRRPAALHFARGAADDARHEPAFRDRPRPRAAGASAGREHRLHQLGRARSTTAGPSRVTGGAAGRRRAATGRERRRRSRLRAPVHRRVARPAVRPGSSSARSSAGRSSSRTTRVDATERDRLRVQARVVDDNVGQQLDGINRALASVRDEFLATPPHSVSTLLSARLKALSDAIPGVRSMVAARRRRHVVASSVDTLLGRDFADRDYFRAPRASRNAGDALRRRAVQDLARQLHGRLRARDRRAERRLRRRRRRRARAGVLRGADALGAVRARHVGLARPRRRQGVRHHAAQDTAPDRGRLAAVARRDRPAAQRPAPSAAVVRRRRSAARARRG